jgi:HEAT repeat protein
LQPRHRPHRTSRAHPALSSLFLGAALLTGCGGSAGESEPSPAGAADTGARASDAPAVTGSAPAITYGSTLPDGTPADKRLRTWVLDCKQANYYSRDTSDVVAILIGKLDLGASEPLKRALEELGDFGQESLVALRRKREAWFSDPVMANSMTNLVDAFAQHPAPEALDELLEILDHANPTVRVASLRALSQRESLPAWTYDGFVTRAFYGGLTGETSWCVKCMHKADPMRAELKIIEWLTAEQSLVQLKEWALTRVAGSALPTTLDAADRALRDGRVKPDQEGFFRACLVDRDPEALAELGRLLADRDPEVRRRAVAAAAAARQYRPIAVVLENDADPMVKATCLAGLVEGYQADGDEGAQVRQALDRALDDPDPSVRDAVLPELIALGHPRAVDRGVQMLDGSERDVRTALLPLRQAMQQDEELAARVLERLERRLAAIEEPSLAEDYVLLQTFAQVPLAAAARTVMSATEWGTETFDGLPVHEWLAIQAASTGRAGRAVLFERLGEETSHPRRLDLLWAVASARDEFARESLIQHLRQPQLDPWETVFASDLLAQCGPTVRVAPILKQVSRRLSGGPRLAMQCLMARWY